MGLLYFYIFLTFGFSFLCSLLESVILSVSPAFVELLCRQKVKSGFLLSSLRKDMGKPLAAILTLNTVANTLGAMGIGAQVQILYGDAIVTSAAVIVAAAILIFSEVIPKTLGAAHWKSLAAPVAYIIRFLIFALYPFVLISEFVTRILSKPSSRRVTREEMIVTAKLGADDGSIQQKESLIIKNLLMLDKLFVADIMTPRPVMITLDHEWTVSEVMAKFKPLRYSRIPVYEDSVDNITGLCHRYKILESVSNDQHNIQIKELMSPVHSVPETLSVAHAIDQFIKRKEHIFIAHDEYGVITGLVSLEDTIETLLGVEIIDEFDSVADLRKYAVEQWQIRKKKQRKVNNL